MYSANGGMRIGGAEIAPALVPQAISTLVCVQTSVEITDDKRRSCIQYLTRPIRDSMSAINCLYTHQLAAIVYAKIYNTADRPTANNWNDHRSSVNCFAGAVRPNYIKLAVR